MSLAVRAAAVILVLAASSARGQAALPAPAPAILELARAGRDADLGGHWTDLGRVHDQLAQLRIPPEQRPWVEYYLGYVDWRRSSLAWLGEGPGGTAALQRQCAGHLTRALDQLPGFSEARALLVMCEATMAAAVPDSIPAIMIRVSANLDRLAREAPDNPRARLVRYMLTAFSPRTAREARDATLRAWRGLSDSFPPSRGPVEPDWGGAESWGWLGAVLLAGGQPEAAVEALSKAVAERPDFWWAREIALPQARASRLPHLGD